MNVVIDDVCFLVNIVLAIATRSVPVSLSLYVRSRSINILKPIKWEPLMASHNKQIMHLKARLYYSYQRSWEYRTITTIVEND